MPLDTSQLRPAPLRPGQPKCGQMVGSGQVEWPCSLPQGHRDRPGADPEPCYAVEAPGAIRTWQAWAGRQDAQTASASAAHPGDHQWQVSGDYVACQVPGCNVTHRIATTVPLPADPMAEQFSAATGAQAAIRAQQQQRGTEHPAEPAEDGNDRHGYPPGDLVHHSLPATVTPQTQPEQATADAPIWEVIQVHCDEVAELELGDYVIGFDGGEGDGFTVMRIGQVQR